MAASKCRQHQEATASKMEDGVILLHWVSGKFQLRDAIAKSSLDVAQQYLMATRVSNCQLMGGFENMSNIIQQTDYLCQISGQSANASSIPSTIPTTLNTTRCKDVNSGYEGQPDAFVKQFAMSVQVMPQQHQQQPIQLKRHNCSRHTRVSTSSPMDRW